MATTKLECRKEEKAKLSLCQHPLTTLTDFLSIVIAFDLANKCSFFFAFALLIIRDLFGRKKMRIFPKKADCTRFGLFTSLVFSSICQQSINSDFVSKHEP